MTIPDSVRDDAFELDAKAQVILYKLVLFEGPTFFLSPKAEYTWQGDLYEEVPCHLSRLSRNADGTLSRPLFTVVNPAGIFTASVHDRSLEGASVTRHRIMKADLVLNLNEALSETFRVSRVASVNRSMITMECRGALDGANFKLPSETFRPPEYPHVQL